MTSKKGALPPLFRPASSTSPKKGVVMHQPITYTMDEVKQMLGCEEDTVRNLLQDGLLACVKVGRSWVFPCTAFETSLNQMALDDTLRRREAYCQALARSAKPLESPTRRRAIPVLPKLPEHFLATKK